MLSRPACSFGFVLLVLLGPVACGGDWQDWREVPEASLDRTQRQQYARAVAARDVLFRVLSQRLMAAIAEGGPAGAIEVCHEVAPALAAAVGREGGVTIGRTSYRLRNPANVPPPWAEAFVEERTETTAFQRGPDGRLGVLLPIRLQQPCVACHGPAERIAASVAKRLRTLYPSDRATGFEAGDLRGWFWVDVPAP